jgi:uroporphyrinogen-III decarboxylase
MSDRLLRALRREPVDATPVWFMRQAGRSLPEYRAIRERASLTDIVGDADLCTEVSLQPVRRLGVDAAIVFADITTPLPGIGIDVTMVEGVGPVIAEPIRQRGQVERLVPLDPQAAVGPLLEAIGRIRRAAAVPVIGFAGAPFTLASYLVEGGPSRNHEHTKALMHGDPELWHDLCARLARISGAFLRVQAENGASAVQLFDSWAGFLSRADYTRHVQEHSAAALAAVADLDVPRIHFAGAPFTLAAYLVEGRSPRDLAATKQLMHRDRPLWDELLGRLVDMDIAYLRAQVAAGAQVLQLFDSWVGQLAPVDYRSAVLPHVRRLFEGLAELDVPVIHFGTGTAGLLADMAEAGGDAIGLDWRIGLADGRRRIAERVGERAVQGNLDPHVLLGPWPEVERQASCILDEAGDGPGHVFNLGHGVLPPTDPDRLARLVDLVHERTSR